MTFNHRIIYPALLFLVCGCWEFKLSELDTDHFKDSSPTDAESASETETDSTSVQETEPDSETIPTSPCAGVYCNTPPEDTCDISNAVKRYSRVGYCVANNGIATCKYPSYSETCLVGSCLDGTCPEIPAQGRFCYEPPSATCDGDNLTAYATHGVAVQEGRTASCIYSRETIPCAHGCAGNRCSESPCDGVICATPPANYCHDDSLISFEPLGRCSQKGQCIYYRNVTECDIGCTDGACNEADLCRYTLCANPPSNFCLDENTLYSYANKGYCEEGACIYQGKEIDCPCENGQCIEDSCLGVACIHPPPPSCTPDGKLRIWDGGAWEDPCHSGACVYVFDEFTCDTGTCSDGRCPDYCEGRQNYCALPAPADHCEGDEVVTYADHGLCQGTGYCEWEVITETCINGCADGRCVAK